MSILSDTAILEAMRRSQIVIRPFDRACLGSNSYDVHLGKTLARYNAPTLDCKRQHAVEHYDMKDDGLILRPGVLYLGVTEEYTETEGYVPFLEGKSSLGRLGLSIHSTAGKGDDGFKNHWTLELSVVQPLRVYPGMPIGQLIYFKVEGTVELPYWTKPSAKYSTNVGAVPSVSQMWRNFTDEK